MCPGSMNVKKLQWFSLSIGELQLDRLVFVKEITKMKLVLQSKKSTKFSISILLRVQDKHNLHLTVMRGKHAQISRKNAKGKRLLRHGT